MAWEDGRGEGGGKREEGGEGRGREGGRGRRERRGEREGGKKKLNIQRWNRRGMT